MVKESHRDTIFPCSQMTVRRRWRQADHPFCAMNVAKISKGDRYNPIKQDISNGRPRQVADIPPFQGYPCNYGALPETQTWEDPNAIDAHTGIGGDDDPLDVCEIGSAFATCGQVKKIKPLGAFVILAEGETAELCDVQRCFPGYLDSLKVWYRR
ncbi:inorganic pyrophosphatase [Penicillium chrysogenum]|uniref:inorganic diphosphatase n=1 Tax=Penicillium chrysogenum TaxID=5076 RepID=A0ABQ8WE07_PENCH|nr:inorganic pyrophosphatase [Penicillium chrysogenum]